MGLRAWALGVAASLLFGCAKRAENVTPSESAPLRDPVRARALASVRDVDAVTNDDLGHGDVTVRRAAVRALSRLDDPRAVPKLLSALSDGDAEVVAFAAHGLGWACETNPAQASPITKALVARSLSLAVHRAGAFDPAYTTSHALARCATRETEPTLRAFLERPAPWPRGAALALGLLASQRGMLAKATQAALLDAAEGPPSLDEALFALGRIEVDKGLRARLVEVAQTRLEKKGSARLFALRALGKAGTEGTKRLTELLLGSELEPAERAEIVRALVRSGEDGQKALRDFVRATLPGDDELTVLQGASFGPLLVAVEGLGTTWGRATLQEVARKAVPEDATLALSRRLDLLRCAAAKRIAAPGDRLLEGCDAPRAAPATELATVKLAHDAEVPQSPVKLRFETDAGAMTITLDASLAPQAVARVVALAKGGYFDGATVAHAIPGFFVRLGGKEGAARPEPLPRETSPVPFDAFTVGLSLNGDELFVTHARLPELDGHYAFLGKADPAFAALVPGDVVLRAVVEE